MWDLEGVFDRQDKTAARRITGRSERRSLSRILLAALPALFAATTISDYAHGGGEFTPTGLYEPEVYRLGNGLQVVLAPRNGTRSVAIRVVVGLGTENFLCRKQETPHFLEHLLFTGTSQHSEEELERLIDSNGGSWNATTGVWQTTYQLDIFSGRQALGIETLHEILTDTQISDEDVETSREILLRETGGVPSFAANLLYQAGILDSATTKAFIALMSPHISICIPPALANDVNRIEIEDAYRRYYVPANMTLVVVGDFELDVMRSVVDRSFGTMSSASFEAPPTKPIPPHPGAIARSGFSDQASVGFVFRTGGSLSAQYAGLLVLESYLNQRLYQVLRVERGLTYTPSVSYNPDPDVGLFWISAEINGENAYETRLLIEEEIDRIRRRDVDTDALENAREGLLLSYGQRFESNADIADYYVESRFELAAHGAFVDEEEMLKSLTVDAILEVGSQAFATDKAVSIRDRRLFFEEILAGSGIAGVIVVAYIPWRVLKRRKPDA